MRQSPPRELKVNCLLSPYPICFMHGVKSILHFKDYWHGIPEYLADHGYMTIEFFANWRGPNKTRLDQFAEQMDQALLKHEKIHVIAHSLGTVNILELVSWPRFKNRIASVTLVSPILAGTPWAEFGRYGKFTGLNLFVSLEETLTAQASDKLLQRFKKPEGVLFTAILSNPRPKASLSPKLRLQHHLLSRILRRRGVSAFNDGIIPLDSQRVAEKIADVIHEFPGDHMQVVGGGPWPENEKTAHEFFLEHSIFLAEHCIKNTK